MEKIKLLLNISPYNFMIVVKVLIALLIREYFGSFFFFYCDCVIVQDTNIYMFSIKPGGKNLYSFL
uniref:Uncharacterized protein n=1 Tax=Rhizophora mucronata TaxID=61149 RepID=A0A2P2N3P9_RHIMU